MDQTRRCGNCATDNAADARFCSGCGASFQQAVADPAAPDGSQCPNCSTLNVPGAQLCAKCYQPVSPSTPAPTSAKANTNYGCVGCLGFVGVIFLFAIINSLSGGSKDSTPPTTVAETTAPVVVEAPAPVDLHAKRAAVKTWWGGAVIAVGIPYAETYLAIKTGMGGDLVAAASAAHHAHQVDCEKLSDAPDGLASVNDRVQAACSKMNTGVADLSAYFDSETDGAAAHVGDDIGEVRHLMDDARISLAQHYREWGGDPKDLPALDDMRAFGDALSSTAK